MSVKKQIKLVPFEKTDAYEAVVRMDWTSGHGQGLKFDFEISGDLSLIDWPMHTSSYRPEFKEDLWKATCFEIFLAKPGDTSYWEWNFSPSGDRALFQFSDYRKKMDLSNELERAAWSFPKAHHRVGGFMVLFNEEWLQDRMGFKSVKTLDLNPTLILKKNSGSMIHLASQHPPQGSAGTKPDFHDRKYFINYSDQ